MAALHRIQELSESITDYFLKLIVNLMILLFKEMYEQWRLQERETETEEKQKRNRSKLIQRNVRHSVKRTRTRKASIRL